MIRSKLKEACQNALKQSFYLFKGSGIGKVPGLFELYLSMYSIFSGDVVEVEGQKFCVTKYSKPRTIWYHLVCVMTHGLRGLQKRSV